MTETVSNISKKAIVESRRGKDKIGKGKRAQSSTSKRAGVKPRRKDQVEDESLTETISNKSKKVIVDIKHKEKKKSVKPRRRDEPDIVSESSHLSKKIIDGTTKKLQKRSLTKPRRRDEPDIESESSHLK